MSKRSVPSSARQNVNKMNAKMIRRKKRAAYKLTGILVTILIITVLSIFFSNKLVSAHSNVNNHTSKIKYYKSIQIQSGDTLWQIAEQNMSDEYDSITDYILEVKRINNLASDNIQSNQYLTIPYYNISDNYNAKR